MRLRLVVATLGICLPLIAAAPKQAIKSVTTDRVNFVSGGTIRVSGALGEVDVEAWDQRAVEITVTRTLFPHDTPKEREQAKRRLDGIRVAVEHPSNTELAISTILPSRRGPFSPTTKDGAMIEYRFRVPPDSRLSIRNVAGDVMIYGVGGDIDASAHGGSILLQLPEPGPYSIDAKCRVGGVYSEFNGNYHNRFFLGENFAGTAASPVHSIRLRVGVGRIDIQRIAPVLKTEAARPLE
jgi:hypothetical protein